MPYGLSSEAAGEVVNAKQIEVLQLNYASGDLSALTIGLEGKRPEKFEYASCHCRFMQSRSPSYECMQPKLIG